MEPARARNRFKDRATPVELVQVALCLGANRAGVEQGAAVLSDALRRRLTGRGFDDLTQRISRVAEVRAPALNEAVALPDEEALHVTAIARQPRGGRSGGRGPAGRQRRAGAGR